MNKPARRPAPRRTTPQGEVRIIGGLYKRSKLNVPDLPGLRPTPDRVRETVFNWLGQSLAGLQVLDLYAGTGVLGLEAASRGAARVVLVEQQPRCAAAITAAAQRLGATQVEVLCADALQAARQQVARGARFDVVFIDPPYALNLQATALEAAARLLTENGVVYLEAGSDEAFAAVQAAGWDVWRAGRAGQVHFALLHCSKAPALAVANAGPGG